MTRRPERVEFDAASDELRVLLNRWDPLGVFHRGPDAPEDEYDCLIPGLFKRLRAGAGEDEVFAFLHHEIAEHFGLEPRPEAERVFARELLDWWSGRP